MCSGAGHPQDGLRGEPSGPGSGRSGPVVLLPEWTLEDSPDTDGDFL